MHFTQDHVLVTFEHQVNGFLVQFGFMQNERKNELLHFSAGDYRTVYGKLKFPFFGNIALRNFIMPVSSASLKRIWNIFAFLQNKSRNRLRNEKVNKLVF